MHEISHQSYPVVNSVNCNDSQGQDIKKIKKWIRCLVGIKWEKLEEEE